MASIAWSVSGKGNPPKTWQPECIRAESTPLRKCVQCRLDDLSRCSLSGKLPRCAWSAPLVDLFHSAVAELSAAQSCDRGLDMLSASLVIRIDRAAQDAIAANAAVEEHGRRCSHCGGLRRC